MSEVFWSDGLDWDILILGGVAWPGICNLSLKGSTDVEKSKAKGSDGRAIKDNGYNGTEGTITLTMWLDEQWQEFQRILPQFRPRKGGSVRTPLEIQHPMATVLGLRTIYIKDISLSSPKPGGALVVSISIEEWFPMVVETKASTKPKGLDGTDTKGGPFLPIPEGPNAGGYGDSGAGVVKSLDPSGTGFVDNF